MPAVIPNEGELRLINEILDGGLARENWTLKLYKTNVTPAETDTTASYTESDFTGYTAKTLTRTVSNGVTWGTPASGSPTGAWSGEASVAESAYVQQTWTCGASGNTVYGYFVVGATSTKLIMAELFAAPRTLVNSDVLNLTPRFGVA
jgi:hypothetical protein